MQILIDHMEAPKSVQSHSSLTRVTLLEEDRTTSKKSRRRDD
jgi:hypothetical protein